MTTWSGAYAGVFVHLDTLEPFLSVALKVLWYFCLNHSIDSYDYLNHQGTQTKREWLTDADWLPMTPSPIARLWGAQTHSGFFKGLFAKFDFF